MLWYSYKWKDLCLLHGPPHKTPKAHKQQQQQQQQQKQQPKTLRCYIGDCILLFKICDLIQNSIPNTVCVPNINSDELFVACSPFSS